MQSNSFRGAAPSSESPVNHFDLEYDYELSQLNGYGVLGVGASASLLATMQGTSFRPANSLVSAFGGSGAIGYHARFSSGQFVVPTIAYEMGYTRYRTQSGANGGFLSYGPTIGIDWLLNAIDPRASAQNFKSRVYLVTEAQILRGSDANFAYDGAAFFGGLRFEF